MNMSSTFEEIYNEIVESSRGNLTNEEYRESNGIN